MRRVTACLLVLLSLTACVWAQDSYKERLVAQFPFYQVATGQFAPVYPALARQLVEDYGVTEGVCVDVGGAEGSLAVAIAKATNLTVYVVDIDPAAVRLCNLRADEEGLRGRVRAIEGDAQNLLLREGFADLVVSRNSMFQWPDKQAGLLEAYRILKPGGVALLGGGYGRLLDEATRETLVAQAERKRAENPDSFVQMPPDLPDRIRAAGVKHVRLLQGPTAFDWWLEMRK